MKRVFIIAILSVALLAMVSPASFAQGPYNLAEYMLMSPGSWRVIDQTEDGIPDSGYKYDSIQGYLVEREYDKVGPSWVADSGNIWEFNGDQASLVGLWEPGPGVRWLSEPILVPTAMSVGDTLSWTIQVGGKWNIGAMALTDDEVTVPTLAGTFTNCLEVWELNLTEQEGGYWETQVELKYYARYIGEVRRLGGDMQLGDPQTYEEFFEQVVNYHMAP